MFMLLPMYADVISVPKFELDLDITLMSGQSFRWRKDNQGWWISPIGIGAALRIQRVEDIVFVESFGSPATSLASTYFQVDKSLTALRDRWENLGEEYLVSAIDSSPGLRILRQDPVECLFSFLCSSAAPIHRIRKSVQGMCGLLGQNLGAWHGVELFSFPELSSLAAVARRDLDQLGLGFRGRYVIETAAAVLERGGRPWLESLLTGSYEEAKANLMELPGVGEKVADCVCLFSLNKDEAVPIDVHMARVARRHFDDCRDMTTLTKKAYATSSNCFRQRYGGQAGWAQQYFFFAEIERRGLWDQEIGRHRPKTG
jgi:N-glycosylase/DNA lyase